MLTIKSRFRNNLEPHRNKKYVKMVKDLYPNLDLDHIIFGKLGQKKPMDYLLCPKDHAKHINQTYGTYTDDDFIDDLINALNVQHKIIDKLMEDKNGN